MIDKLQIYSQTIEILGELAESLVEHCQHLVFGADVVIVWNATEAMEMHALSLIACICPVNFNTANDAHEEDA